MDNAFHQLAVSEVLGKLSFPGWPEASFLIRGTTMLPLPGMPEGKEIMSLEIE